MLDLVEQYLNEQYFGHGRYGVRIETKVEDVPGNKVKVKIDIKEGKRAKIQQINVVGNEAFTDKEIEEGFELHTPNWLSWYKQDDRYSRESLQGDLEKLRSFYMDRGYANFQIDSTQVAIAPEKDDIFITVNINEGKVYNISDVKLAGTFVVPEEELKRYVLLGKGQQFNRKLITTTQELIQNRLGADGYAFAKVDPVPTPNDQTNEVSVTFFIDPGNRVYVRNVTFSGATGINDEVLRREMRQLEGAWLSNIALDRSKQRIQRLPYVKKVDSKRRPSPARRISSTWTSRSRKARAPSSAAASATPRRTNSRCRGISPTRTSSAPASAWPPRRIPGRTRRATASRTPTRR